MTEFTIDELKVPDSLDQPGVEDFLELVELRNRVETETLGTDALAWDAEGLRVIYETTRLYVRRHLVARVEGRIVGRAIVTGARLPGTVEAEVVVEVRAEHRGRGIGSALTGAAEGIAMSLGHTVLQCEIAHSAASGGERVPSPTGFGDLPATDPGVRFLRHHGYSLEMVNRISQLDLAESAAVISGQLDASRGAAGAEYRLVTWAGRAPEDRYEDLALLKSAMDTDAPSAGMESTNDPWDVERVREWDGRMQSTGRLLLTAAAEHVPTGRLVAYTELGLPRGEAPPATQEDTLVLIAHRGHRLGMWLKAANLHQLQQVSPRTRFVTTFNAEDNRPMLDVNEALGFRPIGYEGSWQKDLR